jgi:hypothetical protein
MIQLFIGAITLLIVGICIKVAIRKSDRLLQRRINNLGRRDEEK